MITSTRKLLAMNVMLYRKSSTSGASINWKNWKVRKREMNIEMAMEIDAVSRCQKRIRIAGQNNSKTIFQCWGFWYSGFQFHGICAPRRIWLMRWRREPQVDFLFPKLHLHSLHFDSGFSVAIFTTKLNFPHR